MRRLWWLGPLLVAATLVGASPVDAAPARRTVDFARPGVNAFGNAPSLGQPSLINQPVTGMARTPSGKGYWLAAADGGVFSYGNAPFYGSAGSIPLQSPVIGMTSTPDGRGYWMLAADGGIFTYGNAKFYGSTGAMRLNAPVVGMATTPTGRGYWLVAADGGIFTYGDAKFHGSAGSLDLAAPIVAMASTPNGGGYWMLGADGGIFTYGNAPFLGSAAGQLPDQATGFARTKNGTGYWILSHDGSVVTKGDAVFHGSTASPVPQVPARGIVSTPDDGGYWILAPDAMRPTFRGGPSQGAGAQRDNIVTIGASQLGANPDGRLYCNPYGPCYSWCSLYLTWVWQQTGVPVPSYAFTGSLWNWSANRGRVKPAYATANLGDAVFWGTGPQSAASSVHVSIVAARWPDGTVITVDGNSGPGPEGRHNVVTRRPFKPALAELTTGTPVYGLASP
jgi:hypothetical protein